MMIRNIFTVTSQDTKLLRHEQSVEEETEIRRLRQQKTKKILVTMTAKDNDIK